MPTFDPFLIPACPVLALDDDGRIVRVGTGWPTLLDWPESTLGGRTLPELIREGHRERAVDALAAVVRGHPVAVFEAEFPRPDGRLLRLACRCFRATEPGIIFAVCDDVTMRVAMQASDSKLQSMVDLASESWFVHDMNGDIVDVNHFACDSLGYTREEILSMQIADIEMTIKPGSLDGVWRRMEIGKPITVEGRHRRKDGVEVPVEVRLGLFEVVDQVLMLALARDITRRKAIEAERERLTGELVRANSVLEQTVADRTQQLREALGHQEAVLANLADGLVAVDVDGCIFAANPSVQRMFGLPPDGLRGRPADGILPADVLGILEATTDADAPVTREVSLRDSRIGLATASSVREGDETFGAVVLVRDVTLEREIDRMKTDFIATVSHELRTPLTSVMGFAKLTRNKLDSTIIPRLVEMSKTDKKLRRALNEVHGNVGIIVSEGQRLTSLINDVLDISKMEAGRIEWSMDDVDVAALVSRAAETTASLFTDGPLRLVTDVDEDLPVIRGDADRLHQVLLNLLSNAVKFTDTGIITVGARRVDGVVEVSVTDPGSGIPASQHEAIFEKFKQVGDTLTGKPKGTGLGLPICKQIVEHHEGAIWVESTEGIGSRFAFTVPIPGAVSRKLSRVTHQVDRVTREDLDKRDILVVDDDPALRELLRQELSDGGYRVRLAANGLEAIQAVRSRRPDLIVLDVMMPEISGFDVAAMLKNDPTTSDIPIIILSIIQDEARGARLGVDRYLTKPTEAETLVSEIEGLLATTRPPRRVLVVDTEQTTESQVSGLLEARGFEVVGVCTDREELVDLARSSQPDMILVSTLDAGAEEMVKAVRFDNGLEHIWFVMLVDHAS